MCQAGFINSRGRSVAKKQTAGNGSEEITAEMLRQRTLFHRKYSRGKGAPAATPFDNYWSFAHSIRDLVIDRFVATQQVYEEQDVKRVYYFSLEFLIGRLLQSNMLALGVMEKGAEALKQLGMRAEELYQRDVEAGLGNGGLGRLAACLMDSLASLQYPAYGYGLRYEHGIFRQEFEDGWQQERPDNWLALGYPWEMIRPEYAQPVCVYGRLVKIPRATGGVQSIWTDWQLFEGVPYDIPVIGYNVNTVNMLRLWSARAAEGFRLDVFNQGDYVRSVEEKNWAENVTKVLYPSDSTHAGKELRLIQEYFLVTCSLRDIMRRYVRSHRNFDALPEKMAVQMNDTHPALAVAELMNCLCYEHDLPWDLSWDLTCRCLNYTNHTLLPEALEKWPEALMQRVLPRHMDIIYEINHRYLQKVEIEHPGDMELIRKTSIIEEAGEKQVRMANLAIIGSRRVNGVSALHSGLVKEQLVPHFARIRPDQFINITNGVTHRRWLMQCNPGLAELITERIGDAWVYDLEKLRGLEPLAEDREFCKKFMAVKQANKKRLTAVIRSMAGVTVRPEMLFDVQIKRMHMYKRQMLCAMYIIELYQRIKKDPSAEMQPRAFIFSAKAAPAYHLAKRVIKLINTLAAVINNDPDVAGRLKVVFLPDYNVSLAEKIVPAADLSEQISTAGMEASGTGNMKLALNGALTIGTWDGATIEIAQQVEAENIFIFGHREEDLQQLRREGYNPWSYYDSNPVIREILEAIRENRFDPKHPGLFSDIFDHLTVHGDTYFYLADYAEYSKTQDAVSALYRKPAEWAAKAVLNVARMGWFSSDRTVREYAEKVWEVDPVRIEHPQVISVT